MLPKILIITYYWPPSGGPAVQRWLSFANILAEKGVDVHVLTVDEQHANYPAIDASLAAQVSKKLKVSKTKTSEIFWVYKKFIGKGKAPAAGFANEADPSFLQKLSRFVRGNFFIPDPRKSWNKFVIPKAREIIINEKTDLVITAGPPHSTHLNGLQLQKEFNIKWIADFHDAWTDVWYYDKLLHTQIARRYDQKLERKVLENADAVLTVGKLLKNVLAGKSSTIDPEKIQVVSMGYDEKLFVENQEVSSQEFRITYTGTIDDSYEPEVLFRALKKVKEKNPGVNYKLRFIGLLAEGLRKKIIESGLEENLEIIGYVPHHESVKYLLNSNALLLVSPKVKSEEIIIPGKIYEYLAARKPVINIGSLSTESARIISECEAGENFDRTMENELADYLQQLTNSWKTDPQTAMINLENKEYRKYSRVNEAAKLSGIIEGIIAGEQPLFQRKQ